MNKEANQVAIDNKILKPHGVAVWLFSHYPTLTVAQISSFCGLDPLKVGFLRTELEQGKKYALSNPIQMGYTNREALENAVKNPSKDILYIPNNILKIIDKKKSKRKYISLIDRKNKISAALWIINSNKNTPFTVEDIKSLTGASVVSIKKLMTDRKYALSLDPIEPFKINLCTRQDLEKILNKYKTLNTPNNF